MMKLRERGYPSGQPYPGGQADWQTTGGVKDGSGETDD